MEHFLKRTAALLLERHRHEMDRVLVVLPSRRAALHLRSYLAQSAHGALWSPEMLDPGAFLQRIAGWRKGTTADLLLLLYQCHREQTGPAAQSLAEFLEWAPTTLRDFSEADNHLIDLDDLYRDLRAYHEIEEWSLRSTEPLSTSQQLAVRRWTETGDLHRRFAAAMAERGFGTTGAIGREAVRRASQIDWQAPWSAVWAVGLNALEPSLKAALHQLRVRGLLSTCWDADQFYLNAPDHEAGRFLRESIKALGPGAIPATDAITREPRAVKLVTLPERMAMCRYAAQWAAELPPEERRQAAIVLADEQLLLPLLHALPADIAPLNVSLGVPVQVLPLWGLAKRFLLFHAQTGNRIRIVDLCALLNHPLLHQGDSTTRLVEALHAPNLPHWERLRIADTLREAGLVEQSLAALEPQEAPPDELLQALFRWVLAVRPNDVLAREQIYHLTLLQRELSLAMKRIEAGPANLHEYIAIRERLIGQARISFFGEPLEGLQVLGVLETRALSFKHVLVVGATEGILIGQDEPSSWIPFDLRRHFRLPLRSESEAVASYHVHRLMQGAGHFVMAHAPAADGSGSPARFIEQWDHELAAVSATKILRLAIAVQRRVPAAPALAVAKDLQVVEQMQALLARGLSPTAMAAWLRCPMDFHAKYILGIEEQGEASDGMGDDVLGNAVHTAIERIYEAWLHSPLSAERLRQAAQTVESQIQQALAAAYPKEMLAAGDFLLRSSMASEALRRALLSEADRPALHATTPIAVEHMMKAELRPGLWIKGKADRIERRDGVLCVLDIKTGAFQSNEIVVKVLGREQFTTDKQKALQLMIYAALAFHEDPTLQAVQAGIIPLRYSSKPDAAWLTIEGESLIRRERLADIQGVLLQIIDEMLDPDAPIAHDPSSTYCRCCVA